MALPGEIGHGNTNCMDCGEFLPLQVLQSAAGYYVGTFCENCGPYSRESGYYKKREEAQAALDSGEFGRSTKFNMGEIENREEGQGREDRCCECGAGYEECTCCVPF